jgi:hypothetical protein
MSEVYRVFAYDLNTNTRLCEIPAQGLAFDCRLNDSGSIAFTVPISRPQAAAMIDPLLSLNGNPFAVYVDRSGIIVWGGIVWTVQYDRASGVVSFGGKEFLSYFAQRTIVDDYSVASYPVGVEPGYLTYKVISDCLGLTPYVTGYNIGFTLTPRSYSSTPAVIPGYPFSQHTLVGQVIQDMAALSISGYGSVDTTIQCYWDGNGDPQRLITVWTPRAGQTGEDSQVAFDLSRVVNYSWAMDSTRMGTKLTVVGSGTGDNAPEVVVDSVAPVGGLGLLPRLDKVISASNVNSQDQVNAMAVGLAQQYGTPLATPTLTQPTAVSPALGEWTVGDDARIYIAADDYHRNGVDEVWRIVQHSVTVPDQGVPVVTVTFNPPPTI